MKKAKGFTLIELLLAVSIFSVIAVSIYSAFHTGIFAWRRLNTATDLYQDTRIALELISREIANYIPSENIRLEGGNKKITFLARVDSPDVLNQVSFFYDLSAKALMRSRLGLKSLLNGVDMDKDVIREEFLSDTESLEFKYRCKKQDKKDEYEWVDLLDPKEKPVCTAVRISITRKGINFTKSVPLYAQIKNEQQQQT